LTLSGILVFGQSARASPRQDQRVDHGDGHRVLRAAHRRLACTRYADDHIPGFTGPKAEAEQIKADLAVFLRETLGLELSQDKTLISHARTQLARFLGYHITVQHCDTKLTRGRSAVNGAVALRVSPDVIKAKAALCRQRGNPARRTRLQNVDSHSTLSRVPRSRTGILRCRARPRVL
jgi:hypothetical protein